MVRVRAKVALNMKVNPQNSDPNSLAFVLINHRFSNDQYNTLTRVHIPKLQSKGTNRWGRHLHGIANSDML